MFKIAEKSSKLNRVIWGFLTLFSCIVMLLLFVVQILLLNKFYELYKTNQLNLVADHVKNLEAITSEELDEIAYDKGICIFVYNKNTLNIISNSYNKGCIAGFDNNLINYVSKFVDSGKKDETIKVRSKKYQNENLIRAVKYSDNSYVFFNTSIEPLDASINLLKSQYLYIFITIFTLSIFLSYFISNLISNPIVKISKSASKMANGNFKVSFLTDSKIHEIKELSDTLEDAKIELSKTDELRKDLMANVGHDLKTPLTMIKAYAEMSRDLDNQPIEKKIENMNIIIEETDRLTELVGDILDLSKIQSSTYKLDIEKFDLNELLKSIIKRYDIVSKNEGFKFIYENDKPIFVKADKRKIEQVVYNLINNAINYTGKNKTIYIELTNKKSEVKIGIRDTGNGIEKQEINNIWTKYYHNEKKHKRNLHGTGLGLSIVKSILEEHGFEYGVDSVVNVGTTFYFVIKK